TGQLICSRACSFTPNGRRRTRKWRTQNRKFHLTLLAIETSCDETSAAVIRDGVILSNIVSSQTALHAEYGGVVPELATREHLRNWAPVTRRALEQASVKPNELQAVAATQGPGLPNALLI